MKQFDKWNMKQPKVIPPFEGKRYYSLIDEERRVAWKAALGWILNKFDGKTDMLTLGLDITEELK